MKEHFRPTELELTHDCEHTSPVGQVAYDLNKRSVVRIGVVEVELWRSRRVEGYHWQDVEERIDDDNNGLASAVSKPSVQNKETVLHMLHVLTSMEERA